MELIASDSKSAIVGLGRTGMSCAEFLSVHGKNFFAVEENPESAGAQDFRRRFPEAELRLGAMAMDSFDGASEIIASPGVSLDKAPLQSARDRGVPIRSDIDLFVEYADAPIVAITGSNAKSTVTTLVGQMAERAGRNVAVGGNLGIPALELLGEDAELYVLELSSFQLERTEHTNAEVAVVLNISPDHMDRYANLQEYHRAKHRVFRGCKNVIVNRADPLTRPLLDDSIPVISFGLSQPDFNSFGIINDEGEHWLAWQFEKLMPVSELKIPGRHNWENALAALAIGHVLSLPMEAMLDALRAFPGLEHRCQFVDEIEGIRFYNDSKGTNIGATAAALGGLAEDGVKNIVLLLGGVSKGADFQQLLPALSPCKNVLVFGKDGERISEALQSADCEVVQLDSWDELVKSARACATSGDSVLFSPACASFDMFANFEERGRAFVAAVAAMKGEVEHD